MTYEAFIGRFEKKRITGSGVIIRCPVHEDSKASLSIGKARDGGVVLKCFAGCRNEEIVQALGLRMNDLFVKEQEQHHPFRSNGHTASKVKAQPAATTTKGVIEATYSYTDSLGRELFQAVRMKPKDFRQRHQVNGVWVWSMDGVERVLYRLPEVEKSETVWVVEGEKDADNLCALGICATTNVGGAGKWLDGYTESLKGKNVIICGDNDEPGRKHTRLVFDSIAVKAKTVRMVTIPGAKDVSDFIAATGEKAKVGLTELAEAATPHYGGVRLPVYSMADIEPRYAKQVKEAATLSLNLGSWLPSLNRLRPLTLGALMLVVGDTGIGKTNLLLNIAANAKLPTLMFELELTDEELFERFFAHKAKMECADIEREYKGHDGFGVAAMTKQFPNIYICPEPRVTVEMLESIVLKSELKIGVKPILILLDYVQLMGGPGNSRYEKASAVAEGLKLMAKATRTIVIVASQVDRASGREGEIGLHSAKDTGSLENSAGLVVAAWRDKKDHTLMHLKVLKSTRGGAGLEVRCNFDGARATITERIEERNYDKS